MSDALSSIRAFSRSSRRATKFKEVVPSLRVFTSDASEDATEYDSNWGQNNDQHAGQQDSAQFQSENEDSPLLGKANGQQDHGAADDDSPLLRSKLNDKSYDRVKHMNREREEARAQQDDNDKDALLVKKVQRSDGTQAEVIIGQSTLSQTIFNASNVLIGVGMLSLPLGIRYAGWIFGIGLLVLSAFVTKYTANLLAKCLDIHSSLANFADIAYVAFGEKGRIITSIIFTLELTAACISLVMLFADSLQSLIDGPDEVHWKIFAGCVLAPLNFLPMTWLSFTSFLGIFCGILLIVVTMVAGFLKSTSPGSLLEVATTYALPEHWKALPLSFGLLMAVWGGHSVFPNIYRDMSHPHKYGRSLNMVFSLVTTVDISMAVVGYLMYGSTTKDEISTNVLTTSTYPSVVKYTVLVLIAIIPLTKFPLNCAPIVSTLEVALGTNQGAKANRVNQSRFLTTLVRSTLRLAVTGVIILLAILVPTFELISAIMGAAFCFLICIIMPVVFHLKMFRGQITKRELIIDYTLIVVSTILGIVGTVWEFLPRPWLGL